MQYIILNVTAQDQNIEYGLHFKSYEVEKEKRTGLNLTPDKPLSLSGNFSISFDFKVDSVVLYPFGYVLRIINEDGQHIDFLMNERKELAEPKLMFAYSSTEVFNKTFREAGLRYSEWAHYNINIDSEQHAITVTIGDLKFSKVIPELIKFDKVIIVFGKCNYPGFQLTDIPYMSLKNVEIKDGSEKVLYKWPLSRYSENGVYDEIKHHYASCENPEWIINRHVFWEKYASFRTKLRPQVAYNSDDNEIAVYDQSHFYRYKLDRKILSKNEAENNISDGVQSNNLIYHPSLRKYVFYMFDLETEKNVLIYDTLSNKWDKKVQSQRPPDFWHHNRALSDSDGFLFLFGGYGHHTYRNDVRTYNFESMSWNKSQLKGDVIEPRYLAGMGKIDDKRVLIFGGFGSYTGSQELSPRYYYDLYEVNTETLESKKLWTLKTPDDNFVVSNTIIVDTLHNSFYALTYPSQQFHTKMVLRRFSIDKPEYELFGDSIAINFEDNKSFVDLYFDKASNSLVAVTSGQDNVNDSINTVSIYTLSYPPLSRDSLFQAEKTEQSRFWLLVILIFILLAASTAIYMIYSRRKKTSQPEYQQGGYGEDEEGFDDDFTANPIERVLRSCSVCLFGGFCVVDKDGNDITGEFTPMLKQLFVLILLYTFKAGKGISSVKLREILWFDKSEESAKNNRGVSLSKLRQIFEQVGQVDIKSANSYWSVKFGENIYCDYSQALFLMDKISKDKEPDIKDIGKLLSIVSAGELLPNLQEEWIDPFKADFSNDLIDLLLALSTRPDIRAIPQMCIDLADVIFIHDSLNEDALRLKCSVLIEMRRNGLAQKVYASFVKEYNALFGTDFNYTFDQIINS